MPEGHQLRWSGRQRGDCVFALVDEEAEKAAQSPPVPAVDVPESVGRPHRLVRATRKALGRSRTVVDTRGKPEVIPLYLSRPLVDRALRIMHSLLTEAENRGHAVESRTDLDHGDAVHTVAIVIHGRAFPLALTERTTKVPHEPTAQEIRRQQRGPWTRPPTDDEKFDRRLAIGAPVRSRYEHAFSYSDGARWTLESRLGRLLQKLEHLAAEAERQQREREKELREAEQRHRWYAAIAQAREQQVERHRAKVLTEQVRAWQQALEIRSFCHAARARVGDAPIPADEVEWLEWAEGYAARTDPLCSTLRTPPDPPANREALHELLKGNPHTYPWPFDAQDHWILPETDPADQHL
ncbi:hypothetical protein [Streptomyces sp. GESEQ-35]|uniref:hypothetical protein n=1 Tax=Streptomyces sp. GESEQ-35 TaxID=2812657 RepID=UPI001FF518C8|nr:hypothetical protein [Streptomyces sp. GESEQ-35]